MDGFRFEKGALTRVTDAGVTGGSDKGPIPEAIG